MLKEIFLKKKKTLIYLLSEYIVYFCTVKRDIIMKLNRIKDVLEEKGISQTWLAKKLNKSFNSVNSYVCNRTQPNLETLLQISKILNVDMKDLIADQRKISNDQSV